MRRQVELLNPNQETSTARVSAEPPRELRTKPQLSSTT
jgi:hypothetical protein